MEIYKNKYIIRRFDAHRGIIYSTWLPSTEDMVAKEFKAEMLSLPDQIAQYGAKFVLSNLQNLRFIIDPELQLWAVQTISPRFSEVSLKKQALVIPEDIFSQVSLQQTVEEVEHSTDNYKARFFANEAEAEKWLIWKMGLSI